jgi:hypothetical protein
LVHYLGVRSVTCVCSGYRVVWLSPRLIPRANTKPPVSIGSWW